MGANGGGHNPSGGRGAGAQYAAELRIFLIYFAAELRISLLLVYLSESLGRLGQNGGRMGTEGPHFS